MTPWAMKMTVSKSEEAIALPYDHAVIIHVTITVQKSEE